MDVQVNLNLEHSGFCQCVYSGTIDDTVVDMKHSGYPASGEFQNFPSCRLLSYQPASPWPRPRGRGKENQYTIHITGLFHIHRVLYHLWWNLRIRTLWDQPFCSLSALFTREFLTRVQLTSGCEPSSNPPMDVG